MLLINRLPVLFVGHGNPMNAIEDNSFSRNWKRLGEELGKPKVILSVSAHWAKDRPRISASMENKQIYDMYGFPDKLYQVKYHTVGAPEYAGRALELSEGRLTADNSWGLDHGIWSVLVHMYPKADIPIVTMGVGYRTSPEEHFELGRMLRPLRDEDVLILTSGNVVHNLSLVSWNKKDGFEWADRFDEAVIESIRDRRFSDVVDYRKLPGHEKAFRTVEHFYPLLVALGAACDDDEISVSNDQRLMGAMSMTSYLFTPPMVE